MDELTFEQAFAQLERITRELEGGELSLDAALARFEEGAQLAARCDQLLNEAELRVRQIAPDAAGGLNATPFDDWQSEAG
ncbi:MAG: exodeoxyribonuclease VII small subunit [Anaerolineae bacterium]